LGWEPLSAAYMTYDLYAPSGDENHGLRGLLTVLMFHSAFPGSLVGGGRKKEVGVGVFFIAVSRVVKLVRWGSV